MAQITRSTKISGGTTLSSNTLARATDVETDMLTIFNAHNNHDTGTSKWQVVSSLSASSVPLVVDNSSGSQDVAQFKTNGTTQWNITTAGNLNSNTKKLTGLGAGTANGDSTRYEQVSPLWGYRRPVLQYNSGTVVNIETGINGTSGQAQILFPDGTLRTDSTTTRIQCNFAQVAALTVTAQSGLRTGAVANNTWYAIYAVKSQVNTTDIVAVADTVLPTQANYATLTSNFGTNGFVYLGMVRYGDQSGAQSVILNFVQNGNRTRFLNVCVTNTSGTSATGPRLAGSAGATSLTYTYSAGTGASNIPNNLTLVTYQVCQGSVASGKWVAGAAGGTPIYVYAAMNATAVSAQFECAASEGVLMGNSGTSVTQDINLAGFVDGTLGGGSNPIL